MADILMAFKPKWAELILSGDKTVEVRRVMPKNLQADDFVWIYCRGYVLGYFRVRDFYSFVKDEECPMETLIDEFAEDACLTFNEMRTYWAGASRPGLIFIKEATRNAYPVRWEGGRHPQNFIYLKGDSNGRLAD